MTHSMMPGYDILAGSSPAKSDKEIIRKLFVKKKCIPTKLGMKFPHESYMTNVNLFPDLPTVQLQKSSNVNNVLELLGVRKVNKKNFFFI